MMQVETLSPAVAQDDSAWPHEARTAAHSLETAFPPLIERRKRDRVGYRTIAELMLDNQHPESPPAVLFTRDASPWEMGFITGHRLELGSRGIVALRQQDDSMVYVECTVRRSREFMDGWYEGVVSFKITQTMFVA